MPGSEGRPGQSTTSRNHSEGLHHFRDIAAEVVVLSHQFPLLGKNLVKFFVVGAVGDGRRVKRKKVLTHPCANGPDRGGETRELGQPTEQSTDHREAGDQGNYGGEFRNEWGEKGLEDEGFEGFEDGHFECSV